MDTKPNLTRQYAHEVVTASMHNEVCNLSVAQRARDQAEIIREQRDDLLTALQEILQYCAAPTYCAAEYWRAHAQANAAISKAAKEAVSERAANFDARMNKQIW